MIADWFRGLKRSTGTSLSKTKIPTATLANWDPLRQAVFNRISRMEDTDLFLVYFTTEAKWRRFGEAPTLVIGRVEPMLGKAHDPLGVFINASGLIAAGIEPGSEVIGWSKAGFDVQDGKSGKSFGAGPLSEKEFAQAFLSAMDVFAMIYGVSSQSQIVTLGDPLFESILDATPGLARRKPGKYQLK